MQAVYNNCTINNESPTVIMELNTTLGNVKETDKQNSSYELIEQKPINETPFTAVRVDEKWFLALGKYRLTEPLPSEEACLEEAKDSSWLRLMQIVKIVILEHEQDKKSELTNVNQLELNLNK